MGLNLGDADKRIALAKWQLAALIGTGLIATGVSSTMYYRMAVAETKNPAPNLTADEIRLLAKAEEEKVKKQNEAKKLRQSSVGAGYLIDGEGELTGPSENQDLPKNKSLDEVGGGATATDEIAQGIRGNRRGRRPMPEPSYEANYGDGEEAGYVPQRNDSAEEKVQRTDLEKSMLAYSVKNERTSPRRPEAQENKEYAGQDEQRANAIRSALGNAERSANMLNHPAPDLQGLADGPSQSGAGLMPAEDHAQPFSPGGIGDMRIGGEIGPEQIIRQGKFIDCVITNEVRVDLMDSPVIGMVSRDFVSLDGNYVLVPAGTKLIGTAGRTQNIQQSRVYLRFDRIIFPDQRSAYFPKRRLPAVDGAGSVGVDGDVDRHFMLMFGSAIALGMLDGLAAAVQGPVAGPLERSSARELITARTSSNLGQVVAGVIQRYANVVPTITVEPGSKMKVFFAEDVRMTPYMRSRDLSWVRARR